MTYFAAVLYDSWMLDMLSFLCFPFSTVKYRLRY